MHQRIRIWQRQNSNIFQSIPKSVIKMVNLRKSCLYTVCPIAPVLPLSFLGSRTG